MSPYSGYNGQLLTSVYQPTEMALMHKGPVSVAPAAPSLSRPVARVQRPCGQLAAGAGGDGDEAGFSFWCVGFREQSPLAPNALFLELM